MSMQKLSSCGLAIALIWTGHSALGADGGLSQDTLAQMGLSGLVAMSDAEAESVRGHGFMGGSSHGSRVEVAGSSYANINSRYGDAHSENSYSANGKHEASGKNNSHAGVVITKTHGNSHHDNYGGNGGGNRNYGNSGGGNYPGGGSGNNNCYNGGGGGRTTTTSIKVFAGGSSSAKAH